MDITLFPNETILLILEFVPDFLSLLCSCKRVHGCIMRLKKEIKRKRIWFDNGTTYLREHVGSTYKLWVSVASNHFLLKYKVKNKHSPNNETIFYSRKTITKEE